MGSSGGSSGGGNTVNTIRYAQYIEDKHADFLWEVAHAREVLQLQDSPFASYSDVDVDIAFFGKGMTLASYPIVNQFATRMADLDIQAAYRLIYDDMMDCATTTELVQAEAALLQDEIDTNTIPRMQTGLRDINSAMASTFVVGRALIEDTRDKLIAKFSADLRYRLIPEARIRWTAHLDWNKIVIATYGEILKLYFSVKTDVDEINAAMAAKDKLWIFTILDYERAALGALQGALNEKKDVAGASTAAKVIGGAMSGAAMGAMIGSQVQNTPAMTSTVNGVTSTTAATSYAGYGAIAGAILGAAASYTY